MKVLNKKTYLNNILKKRWMLTVKKLKIDGVDIFVPWV